MGVLLLYHDTFRRPQRLAAHTLEGRESFEIQCARSDCSRDARRPGDAVVRTRGESAILLAKLVKKNLRKLSHAGPTSGRPRRYYWLGVELGWKEYHRLMGKFWKWESNRGSGNA